MLTSILSRLSSDYPWKDRLQYFPIIDSTNDCLKAMAKMGAPHGTALIAGHQTAGHGRLGRSFHSPEGMGIYLSILLRPNCAPAELMHLTCAAAVAMCEAVETACGFRPGIKWTNDLVHGTKKLGGILTELGFNTAGNVDWAIVGIGINCRQQETDFPEEIRTIAASLEMATGQKTEPSAVAAAMLEALQRMDAVLFTHKEKILDAYRKDCITVGQEISILRGSDVRYGKALSVDEDGALVVRFRDGTVGTVNAGEVSVRGMYGYIS